MKTTIWTAAALLCLTAAALPVSAKAPAAKPSAAFTVNDLRDEDGNIMGCTTMLSRVGGNADIFREAAGDDNAKGFMRINGQLIEVKLSQSSGGETSGTRVFKDAAGSLVITEAYTVGAAHQESDSVDLKGALTIGWKGSEQKVLFVGGTAC